MIKSADQKSVLDLPDLPAGIKLLGKIIFILRFPAWPARPDFWRDENYLGGQNPVKSLFWRDEAYLERENPGRGRFGRLQEDDLEVSGRSETYKIHF